MVSWDYVKYFEPKEFDDPDHPGSGEEIDGVILKLLIGLRMDTGWKIRTHWEKGGCVDVEGTHGHAPHSYHRLDRGAQAVDFHFITTADPRVQFMKVRLHPFTGIGVYYDQHWDNKKLPIAFHVDRRPVKRNQLWKREKGEYLYFLL